MRYALKIKHKFVVNAEDRMEQFYKPGKKANYGLEPEKVFVGREITSNYNISVDESVHNMWNGFIPTSSYTENSGEFAGRLGFPKMFLPYGFLMNLTLSLGVENYTHSSLLHLELRDALYLRPAFPGDTFTCSIKITSIKESANGENAILEATHLLSNQKGEPVFSLVRVTLFPRFEARTTIQGETPKPLHNHHFKEKILSRARGISLDNSIPGLAFGDLLLHPYVRPIGKSENLFWATFLKNSHPIHHNYQRFKPGEIVISGGIVVAMVLGIAGREFRQILLPEIKRAFHITPVKAEDRIGAFSFVKQVTPIMPGFEEIAIITYGLRNVDTERELSETSFPAALFQELKRPALVTAIVEQHCPELVNKLCCRVEWTVLRKNEQ
jgi:acyl dehydratase